jgi:hypothetical protein
VRDRLTIRLFVILLPPIIAAERIFSRIGDLRRFNGMVAHFVRQESAT